MKGPMRGGPQPRDDDGKWIEGPITDVANEIVSRVETLTREIQRLQDERAMVLATVAIVLDAIRPTAASGAIELLETVLAERLPEA